MSADAVRVLCLQGLINSNPQLRAMVDANPQLRATLANPEMVRQMMDPQNLSASMQQVGSSLSL